MNDIGEVIVNIKQEPRELSSDDPVMSKQQQRQRETEANLALIGSAFLASAAAFNTQHSSFRRLVHSLSLSLSASFLAGRHIITPACSRQRWCVWLSHKEYTRRHIPMKYLSGSTADSLVSPARLADECLNDINHLLDEILTKLLNEANSLNPEDIKRKGVPGVFLVGGSAANTPTSPAFQLKTTPLDQNVHSDSVQQHQVGGLVRKESTSNGNLENPLKIQTVNKTDTGSRSLARDAVVEAELELMAWKTGQQQDQSDQPVADVQDTFVKHPRGLESRASGAEFPTAQAVGLMRSRVTAYSVSARSIQIQSPCDSYHCHSPSLQTLQMQERTRLCCRLGSKLAALDLRES